MLPDVEHYRKMGRRSKTVIASRKNGQKTRQLNSINLGQGDTVTLAAVNAISNGVNSDFTSHGEIELERIPPTTKTRIPIIYKSVRRNKRRISKAANDKRRSDARKRKTASTVIVIGTNNPPTSSSKIPPIIISRTALISYIEHI